MEEFINEHTILPKGFVHDFYFITNKSLDETNIVIDFELVVKWLKVDKRDLKKFLIKNFEEDFDYTCKKLTKKDNANANNYVEIKISSACFKELCMISQTPKAKKVRMYFLELEKIVKKYYSIIEEKLFKEIGILKNNQKKEKHKVGGVIYVVEAMNKKDGENLYKLGKTGDLEKRLKTYNTGNANNVKILFKIYVNDISSVETCAKKALEKYEYRANKEVYEIDIDMIKIIVKRCDEFADGMKKMLEEHENKTIKAINRIKKGENKIYMIMKKDDVYPSEETKSEISESGSELSLSSDDEYVKRQKIVKK